MTTINNIIDNYSAREAQAIFGDIIKANTTDDQWARIIGAARHSDIVNDDEHPDSKKIGKMAPSQILRAMNANGMAVWVRLIAIDGAEDAANEVRTQLMVAHAVEVKAWPFTCECDRDMLDVDISDMLDLDDTVVDLRNILFKEFTNEVFVTLRYRN